MAKTLYLDCFSGASGDMFLGALLDLGLPLDDLRGALGSLAVDLGGISSQRVLRAGVSATKFVVGTPHSHEGTPHSHDRHPHPHDGAPHPHDHRPHPHDHHSHHSLKEITDAINRSALSTEARQRATHLFERLAKAEAAIHDVPVERIHLHEVGAVDSIADIVGAVYGLEQLGAERIVSSPLNIGGGTVRCEHGIFPVPAPATARLLQGVPVYSGDVQMELVTPTGALLVTGYAQSYGPMPGMTMDRIGYGAGDRDPKRHPNVLRMVVGESAEGGHARRVVEILCEIDDMNPQLFGPLMDRLHQEGALDVFYAPVHMKKNRPGILVTVLARPEDRQRLSGILFAETTTIGVRYQEMVRECLDREIVEVETAAGMVRFKVARRDGQVLNAAPEFDDCARIAAARGLPVKDVQALALTAWMNRTK
ncbi:MAG TPA: nickel pincer cofactor biosynthesis protein LarC [Vicinamibacterales bacterium]|nr:nickel pincer cofactor biosynthesis protein LarC [Vicinamibacterales bacterium]